MTAVSDLADFLDSYGDNHWADLLRKELDGLRAGDEQATRKLRSYFGGMGNLDDRIITPLNGYSVTAAQGRAATRQFWHHLEEILQAGLPIRRNWPIDDAEADRSERRAIRARREAGYVEQPDGTWTRPSD